jgi:hypothetical protein
MGVVLSGGKLLVVVGICGVNNGGAATEELTLDQLPLLWGAIGFANTLRSTGVTGVDESQLDVAGGAGVPLPDGQGGGAKLREVEFAGGAAGCVAKGFEFCDG